MFSILFAFAEKGEAGSGELEAAGQRAAHPGAAEASLRGSGQGATGLRSGWSLEDTPGLERGGVREPGADSAQRSSQLCSGATDLCLPGPASCPR